MGNLLKNRIFQFTVTFVLAFFFVSLPEWEGEKTDTPLPMQLAGDTLHCCVMLDKGIGTKGYEIGYLYEFFQKFDAHQHCSVNLSIADRNPMGQWEKLMEGQTDMLVINPSRDTVPDILNAEVISSIPINARQDVCVVVKKEKFNIAQTINYWYIYFQHTEEFADFNRYSSSYPIAGRNGAPVNRTSISPYDLYVKRYAPLVDWDWRLISALIYKESKFKMGVSSSRGAIGLMQIKEDIARKYGIDDIYDPEQNIKAGISHLARLEKMYRKTGADSTDLIKITLAAYNSGEGRMRDCMSLARSLGKDPTVWENLEETIPLMGEKEYYTNKDIMKYGRFNGRETISFVRIIMERYRQYCRSVKE